MKYDFNKVQDRIGSDSIKWEKQLKFGTRTGLLPFWIADTDFATLPEAVEAMKKRLEHPVFGYTTTCLLYTSPSPRDVEESRMPSSA